MTRFLRLELNRYRHTALFVTLTAAGTLLAALYFFAVVGRFDDSPDSAMLRSYDAVVPLALTVALCVLVVYGAAVYARRIVADYIGNRRIALYSYPGGRGPLFRARNTAHALVIGAASLVGYAVAVSLTRTPWLTWLVTGASVVITVVMLGIQTRRIRIDEVL